MLRPEDCKPGVLVECYRRFNPGPGVQVGGIYRLASTCVFWPIDPNQGRIVVEGDFEWWKIDLFRIVPDNRVEIFRAMLVNPKVDA